MTAILFRILFLVAIVSAAPGHALAEPGDAAATAPVDAADAAISAEVPAADALPTAASTPAATPPVAAPANWLHLDVLVSTISSKRQELNERRRDLAASVDDLERERIAKDVEQLTFDLESLQTAWEMMATGGADLSLFGVKTDTKFDWRNELQSVFEPILVELKRLTERPRKIERLRNELGYFQQRLDAAETALQNVTQYRESAPSPSLKTAFSGLEERWRKRRDDLQNRVQLIDFELQEMFAPSKQAQRDPMESLKELLSGRILNLAIAAVVMLLVYILLRGAAHLYNKSRERQARQRSVMARATGLIFYVATTLLVLFAGMAVFYVQGDWLLLGLFIILLVGAAWAIQRSLPHYIAEARLMLNMGSVREGERLIYRDLPWQVKTLNFFTTLVNPLLEGGLLKVPLRELVGYNSRVCDAGEPWFPSRTGDYVMLADGSFGQVITQTPEQVQLKTLGATRTYRTAAFLEQSPRNLSQQGFSQSVVFGLDYQHQQNISAIRDTFEQELATGLRQPDIAPHLTGLSVEFSAASPSSLDFVVMTTFTGEAAGQYFKIQRLLQRLAVEACNRHQWVIPFNQITVHQA